MDDYFETERKSLEEILISCRVIVDIDWSESSAVILVVI